MTKLTVTNGQIYHVINVSALEEYEQAGWVLDPPDQDISTLSSEEDVVEEVVE
jgi:hypothetical protein